MQNDLRNFKNINNLNTYIGLAVCPYYRNIDSITKKICCGGRVKNLIYIKCLVRGTVFANNGCNVECTSYKNLNNVASHP